MITKLISKPLKVGHKTIALIKTLRGVIALAVSIALWRMATAGELQNVKDQLQTLSQRLEDPIIHGIMHYLHQTNEQHVFLLALSVTLLSTIRFAEAIGLWSARKWAEILTLLSSLIYIPLELIALFQGFSFLVTVILIANVLITAYLFRALKNRSRDNNHIKCA